MPGYMYGIIIKDIGLFKQLTSGGSDVVTAEKKFGALGRPESRFIKFLFAGNHLPRLRETDNAFWSRMVLVPFENQIKQEERDPDLLDKLLKRSDECVKKKLGFAVLSNSTDLRKFVFMIYGTRMSSTRQKINLCKSRNPKLPTII